MTPTFFPTPSKFRAWLEKNHDKKTELLVGYYKVSTKKPSMSWSESVDEALCFGWIDGIRKSIDEESYTIRFTPRKATSIWSAVNIRKMEELTTAGKMTPAGLAVFSKRKEEKSAIYAYEKVPLVLAPAYEKAFKANKSAWTNFKSMPSYYQRVAINWVMTAKQEATRDKRMETLISDSEAGVKIKSQRYGK